MSYVFKGGKKTIPEMKKSRYKYDKIYKKLTICDKLFVVSYNKNYMEISTSNEPFLKNDPDCKCYVDTRFDDPNIVYNMAYHTAYKTNRFSMNYKAIDMPYILVGINPSRDFPNDKYRAAYAIQFIHTKIKIYTTYNNFISGNIFDPYMPTIYNRCCIGNIVINRGDNDLIDASYDTWRVMISRCYNVNDDYYKFFGYFGATPANNCWNVFEYFYTTNLDMENRGIIPMTNPNDCLLYISRSADVVNSSRAIDNLGLMALPKNFNYTKYTSEIRNMPFDERSLKLVTHFGRPKGSKNKKTLEREAKNEILNDAFNGQTPKLKLMYHLV